MNLAKKSHSQDHEIPLQPNRKNSRQRKPNTKKKKKKGTKSRCFFASSQNTKESRPRERERELGDFLSTPRVDNSFEISLQIFVTPLQLFVASSS
jgi:hypothetical protein